MNICIFITNLHADRAIEYHDFEFLSFINPFDLFYVMSVELEPEKIFVYT